jgi:hypothetical protein
VPVAAIVLGIALIYQFQAAELQPFKYLQF